MSKSAEAARPIFVTMGEPAGIGPEIAVMAHHLLKGSVGSRPVKLVGDPDVFLACGSIPKDALVPTRHRARRIPAKPNPRNSAAVCEAIELSVHAAMKGEAAAVVTAPISKAVLAESEFRYPGHTEYLAHLTHAHRAVMMLCGPDLRVVPLSTHVRLRDAVRMVTVEAIVETVKVMHAALANDFEIEVPRIALAGLNPHAGEKGILGTEETDCIQPAAERLRAAGMQIAGPLPADTMFHTEARRQYDAALCMYHDQALIPIKALAFWEGINVTLGLPIVRTSPDHGTAFDIADKGTADPRSMVAAIKLAAQIADARNR